MVFEFKLPDIGEGIHEGEIVEWKVQEGQHVNENDPIVDVMTDKATVEITSPRTGTIAKIVAPAGEVVEVGQVILRIDEEGGAGAQATDGEQQEARVDEEEQVSPKEEKTLFDLPAEMGAGRRRKGGAAAEAVQQQAPPAAQATGNGKALAAPAVRRMAREQGIDLAQVPGSGPGGRVRKEDLVHFAQSGAAAPVHHPGSPGAPRAEAAAAPAAPAAPARAEAPGVATAAEDERVPIRGLRNAIAVNMRASEDFAVPFTYWDSFDVTGLVQYRNDAKDVAAQQGVKLTYLPFIVKAVVRALKEYPDLNAHIDEEAWELVRKGVVNIGIATATDRGLMVVVVDDADRKSIFQIAQEIEALSEKARDGKASREDLTGSTFTITSLGRDGGLGATPVINHPEVAILGVHKIEARPVADEDRNVVVRDMMGLSGTFDHRFIDGHVGAAFIQRVGQLLSQPQLLLLG